MSAKLIVVILPDHAVDQARAVIAELCRRYWVESVPGGLEKISCLVQPRYADPLMRALEGGFGSLPDFALYVQRVEAVVPAVVETQATRLYPHTDRPPTALERFFSRDRISTDELYDDVEERLKITPGFLLTVLLSAIIAALGMRSGQTAAVIGAMVIAPLLGPTMALALSATVGDAALARRAIASLGIGAVLALLMTALLGLVLPIGPLGPELASRTALFPADLVLALASGAAGVLALSQGASLALVGVMIAVALMPPLAACGLLLGAGEFSLALRAGLLFLTNLVCINVAGIATFLIQGLPPKDWRMTGGILLLWALLLGLMASLIAGLSFAGVSIPALFAD